MATKTLVRKEGGKGGKGKGNDAKGGAITGPVSPATTLESCKSVRIFTNTDKANAVGRTFSVKQVLGNGWPPGSTLTLWEGDPAKGEDHPPDPTNGDPFQVARQGEDVYRSVPAGKAIFLHYKEPKGSNVKETQALVASS